MMRLSRWSLGNRRMLGGTLLLHLLLLTTLVNGGVLTNGIQEHHRAPLTPLSSALSIDNGVPIDFQCPSAGSFPVPGFCAHYYYCDSNPVFGLKSELIACPPENIFDDNLSTCNFVSQVVARPECSDLVDILARGEPNDFNTLMEIFEDSFPPLKRQKRIAIATVLTGLITLGSLAGAGAGVASTVMGSKGSGVDLKSIENKLSGIDGKLKDIQISVLENQIENKINSELTHNLLSQGIKANKINFGITQNLIDQGILENHVNAAITQGLIAEGQRANEINFAQIQVGIGELKQFVGQEINKAQFEMRKGFESVLGAIDQSRIQPLVSKLLTLIKGFNEKLNHLQSLPEQSHKDEIERSGGYLEYLESSSLQNTLYDIIDQEYATPKSSSDISSVFILDLLVHGLQIHISMMSSVVSSNVYLAAQALKKKNLDEFNTYMLRILSSTRRLRLALGYSNSQGLSSEVKGVLEEVHSLPFASEIHGLNELVEGKNNDLIKLEADINEFINANTELHTPGGISGKPDFSHSSSSLPIGPWISGKKVSYAIQYVTDKGLSPVGEWSLPYTVTDKANPIISLPSTTEGVTRLVYRKFDQETPELVAMLSDNEQSLFRDIDRDILNAVARPNEDLAISEVQSLIDDGADVNVTLEDRRTPMHYAAENGNLEVMKILFNRTVNIHAKTSDNEEALHLAALYGAEEPMAYLINAGAFINAQTKLFSWSPLHIAVVNSHVGATSVLLQNKAFVNIKDKDGLTPLHLAILGNGETLDVLLENELLDVNAKDNKGQTPLHYAARSSDAYFAKKLLQHSEIDINAVSDNSLSPLHYAAMSGSQETAAELLRYESSVSLVDGYGSTPLHYAAFYGNTGLVLVLIGNDPTLKLVKNVEEKTALDLARENNQEGVVQVLQSEREYLEGIIREEIEKAKAKANNITSESISPSNQAITDIPLEDVNCTQQTVQDLAVYSEETCMHVGYISNYVQVIMSKIPFHIQARPHVAFANIIQNYNTGLENAKSHASVWRNQDSIRGGLQQTFRLTKDFEETFDRKYKIKQNRVTAILQNPYEDEKTKIRQEISALEEDLQMAEGLLSEHTTTSIQLYLENNVRDIKQQLATKQNLLLLDYRITQKLIEMIDFLNFVNSDASKIKQKAANTKLKAITFRDNVKADNDLLTSNSQKARNNLKRLQTASVNKNNKLIQIQQRQEQLERDVEEQNQHISHLYDQMYATHSDLRNKRRELLKKMEKFTTMKYIGALLTPIAGIIGIPLLAIADVQDRRLINEWQTNLNKNRAETARLQEIVKNKEKLIAEYREDFVGSDRNTEELREKIILADKLYYDLQNIIVEVPSLQPSISHAITSLEKIESVFDSVTQAMDEMINKGKGAISNAEKEAALDAIHKRLSELQCNWKNIGLYMMDLNECSKNYELVRSTQLLTAKGNIDSSESENYMYSFPGKNILEMLIRSYDCKATMISSS